MHHAAILDKRTLKKRLFEAGDAHAALVMVGDEATAWAEYGTAKGMKNTVMRRTVPPA